MLKAPNWGVYTGKYSFTTTWRFPIYSSNSKGIMKLLNSDDSFCFLTEQLTALMASVWPQDHCKLHNFCYFEYFQPRNDLEVWQKYQRHCTSMSVTFRCLLTTDGRGREVLIKCGATDEPQSVSGKPTKSNYMAGTTIKCLMNSVPCCASVILKTTWISPHSLSDSSPSHVSSAAVSEADGFLKGKSPDVRASSNDSGAGFSWRNSETLVW